MVKKTTLVDKLVSKLTKDILTELFTPGEQLPPIRTLAKTYDVTVPTVQRTIARLEELGLLSVLHGSGMTVLDPLTNANPMVLSYWFDASDTVQVQRQILGDLLTLHRKMVVDQVIRVLQHEEASNEIKKTITIFTNLCKTEGIQPEKIAAAEIDIFRQMLNHCPQMAYSMMLNVYERVLGNEGLIKHIYAEPQRASKRWLDVFARMEQHDTNRLSCVQLEQILVEFDEHVVTSLT